MRRLLRESPILRLLAINYAAGAALGVLFVALLILFDVNGLGRLVTESPDRWVALFLLVGGSVVTFASVAAGGAIMLLGRERTGTGRREPRPAPVQVVSVQARRPR